MRCCRVLPLLALLLAGSHLMLAAEPIKLPEPLEQQTPWEPSGNIPTNILSAVKKLFEQGFPDPRGCEYRSVKVEVSSVWEGKGRVIETHGWVIPSPSSETSKYVLCWNGVIYRAVEIGKAEDLSAEAASLPVMNPQRFDQGIGETSSVALIQSTSTRVLLLLRCGQTANALRTWNPDAPRRTGFEGDEQTQDYDPYLEMARDWAWSLFDHALSAHLRGDEAQALAAMEKLAEIQPKIETEAGQRGYRHPTAYNPGRPDSQLPYLDFFPQLPEFVADLKRRAAQPDRVSIVENGLKAVTNQAERIRLLINDLELVNARQWGQPGRVFLGGDRIVSALIAEGDPAVEPLLVCLESDKRLTRSVSFHRDFFRRRHIHAVAEAAMAAIQQILHANFNGGPAQIRAYWNENHGIKLEDRWYNTLTNDLAKDRWGEAAGNIIQRRNITSAPGTWFTQVDYLPTNGPAPMRGEPLRLKTNPSVSELLAKRTMEIAAQHDANNEFNLHHACGLGQAFAEWDPEAAVPTSRKLIASCAERMGNAQDPTAWNVCCLGEVVGKLTMARVRGGDGQALKDYANWLTTLSPDRLGTYIEASLEPMVRYHSNAAIVALTKNLFGSASSPWSSLPWKTTGSFNAVESELTKVPAFRQFIARELKKKDVIGFWQWRAPQTLDYEITNISRGGRGIRLPSSGLPADGTKIEMRRCDWVAVSFDQKKSSPTFNPFSSVEKRDALIKEIIKSLVKSD